MLRLSIFVFLTLGSLMITAQSCPLIDLFEVENIDSSILAKVYLELDALSRADSSCVHSWFLKANKRLQRSNKEAFIAIAEAAISWDDKWNISNDSVRSRKYALLGAYQKATGRKNEAIRNLMTAKQLACRYYDDGHKEVFKIYQNIGETYFLNSKFENSFSYLDSAYQKMKADTFQPRKQRIFQYLARIHSNLGKKDEFNLYSKIQQPYIEEYLPDRMSIYLKDRIISTYMNKDYKTCSILIDEFFASSANSKNDIQVVHLAVGNNLISKQYEKAEENLKVYYDMIVKDSLSSYLAPYYHNMSMLYSGYNKDTMAKNMLITSLKHASYAQTSYNELDVLLLLKKISLNEGDIQRAVEYNEQIENLAYSEDIEPVYFQEVGKMLDHYQSKFQLARVQFLETGNIDYLKKMIPFIRRMDQEVSDVIDERLVSNSGFGFSSDSDKTYQSAIYICAQLYKNLGVPIYLEYALELVEQNKGLILLKQSFQNFNRISFKHEKTQDSLLAVLGKYDSIISNKQTPIKERLLAANFIHENLTNSRQITKQSVQAFKNYAKGKIDFEKVRGLNLIQYAICEDTYLCFYNLDDKMDLFICEDRSVLDSMVRNVIQSLSKSSSNDLKENINAISLALLPQEVDLPSDIMIIPDGALQQIPFDVLTHDDKSLVEKTDVNYAFSLRHHYYMNEVVLNQSTDFLCFAPSYKDKKVYTTRNENLGSLKYNIPEVEGIQKYFQSARSFTGSEGNLTNFMSTAASANILHIAAHAQSDTTEAGCHIYFSNEHEDYTLSLSDIYKLSVPAELVTLSACETATGEHMASEGVLSLARGFAYAGARSVVSSLWSANDESTSMIMSSFYKYLKEGYRKDAALRQAKLDFLASTDSEYHHPYYWAAFIPVGDMRPLNESTPTWLYGLGICLLGASGLGFWKRSIKATT